MSRKNNKGDMVENKTSEAQIKASRKWEKKNPGKTRYQRYKSTARTFVRKYAKSDEDVKEMLLHTQASCLFQAKVEG